MDKLKKYIFQEKEFIAKKVTLDLLTKTFHLRKKWEKHLLEITKDSRFNLLKVVSEIKENDDLNSKTKVYLNNIINFIESDKIKEASNALRLVNEDDDEYLVKLKICMSEVLIDYNNALELFLLNQSNLQEIFENVLDGDVVNIDYDVTDKIKENNLMIFAVEVFTDFFLQSKMEKKKQE